VGDGVAVARVIACLAIAALGAAPVVARAQPPAAPPASAPASQRAPAGDTLEPPRPLTPATVAYPAGAPAHTEPIVVKVKLIVGVDGTVTKVDRLSPPHPVFDEAVLAAVRAFRFAPARYGGKPVPVAIAFTHTFQPPLAPTSQPAVAAGPPLLSALKGRLREMGTRAPVTGATVAALIDGRRYSVDADEKGRFRLPLPAGQARVSVHAPGCLPFVQQEKLAPNQEVAVTYYVEREHYDPYEIVVVGEQRRVEVSRITLRGAEIHQIPGTFGDPFRVIQSLPGTAAMASLLPFPVVRGAAPSSTGFMLDGSRVPILFHLLAGPSVVHPEFIDEVQFFPGGAPVLYGGYIGGIIDGRTRRARPDERLIDVDVNVLQAGALIREPFPKLGITVTAAGRYGYPGGIMSLATDRMSLKYWDYQLRVDGGNPRNGWTFFAFGSGDELDTRAASDQPLKTAMVYDFHRIVLSGYHGKGDFDGLYRLVLGYDHTLAAGANVGNWTMEPTFRWTWKPHKTLTFTWGVEGVLRDIVQGTPSGLGTEFVGLQMLTGDLHKIYTGGALLEAIWRPTPRWLIRPGVRGDIYSDGTTHKQAGDPRLTVRYKLRSFDLPDVPPTSDASALWIKAAVGLYHQPPRFLLPLPGLDIMPIKYGLLQAIQTSLGVEAPLPYRFSVSAEGFFSWMDPTIFNFNWNDPNVNVLGNSGLFPTTTSQGLSDAQKFLERQTTPQKGRAYGLELLLRRQAKSGLFGWISYTLSRSERRDTSWAAYDFDRTHILNLVAGLPLPRNWDLGVRLQYQSGAPATTTHGYNTARNSGYVRIDVRIDKRAVFKGWLLDFYVDLLNAALLPEEVMPGQQIRYVLPSIGLRGRF
jgi:TonB family protein